VIATRRERDVRSPRKGTEELRRKIERDSQDPELLLAAWGVGYKFAERL
jgi:DNA-binding response OmpR family regulator